MALLLASCLAATTPLFHLTEEEKMTLSAIDENGNPVDWWFA
jgi:hypothetical protein